MDRKSGDEKNCSLVSKKTRRQKGRMELENEVHGHEEEGGAGKNGGSSRHPPSKVSIPSSVLSMYYLRSACLRTRPDLIFPPLRVIISSVVNIEVGNYALIIYNG
jgi:hypothetical protein